MNHSFSFVLKMVRKKRRNKIVLFFAVKTKCTDLPEIKCDGCSKAMFTVGIGVEPSKLFVFHSIDRWKLSFSFSVNRVLTW